MLVCPFKNLTFYKSLIFKVLGLPLACPLCALCVPILKSYIK